MSGKKKQMENNKIASLSEKVRLELLVSENTLLKKYLDFTGGLLIVINLTEEIIYINNHGCEILGYSREELIGRNWFDTCIPPDSRKDIRNVFHGVIKSRDKRYLTGENSILTKNGKLRLVNWTNSVILDNDGEATASLSSGQDVTERTQTENELLHINANLDAMINNTDDYIMIADQDGFPIMFNDNYKNIFKEMIGLDVTPGIKPHTMVNNEEQNRYWDALHARVIGGEKFSMQFSYPLEGGLRTFEFTFYPISRNGQVIGFSEHSRDITRRLQMEEEIRQSEKMKAIGQLAGGIAHDFNNHLSGILGSADLLRYHLKDDEKLSNLVNIIINAAQLSTDLTNHLLAFARKGKIKTELIDIHNLLSELASLIKMSINKNIEIVTWYCNKKPAITGDLGQLQSVFFNLLINACDAMPGGGTLTIGTKYIKSKNIRKKLDLDDDINICKIFISDTGTGMTRDIMERIFEPFFTTKENGTGMGLAAAYGTITNHGGHIEVDSIVTEGTTFSVYLPVEELKEHDQPHKSSDDEQGVLPGGSILLIDDEEYILRTASSILKHYNYDVNSFTCGKDALDFYSNNWQKIELVIIDVIMPEIDGYEIYKQISRINKDARILIMSGYNPDDRIKEILNMPGTDFMSKPFMMETLLSKVKNLIQ